jgi:antitoxin HicB
MEINTRTYSLSIERHPDGYLAYFPALEGCNTWGRTYEEAVMHAEEALALYLETFKDLGKSIPEEYAFNGAAIMVHGNSGYKTLPSLEGLTQAQVERRTCEVVRQLRGKRIGITEGTTAEQVVREALAKCGLTESDARLFNASYEDNLAAFLAGGLDGFVGGVTERVRARQAGAVELITGAAVSDPVIDGWVTTRTFAVKNPAIMQNLTDIFFRTVRYMNEDVKGRACLATDYLRGKASVNYTPDEYEFAWSFQYFPKTREEAVKAFLDQDSEYYWKRIWKHNNEFLLTTGKIREAVPFDVFLGESTLPPQ